MSQQARKSWRTLDNGFRPFLVTQLNKVVTILRNTETDPDRYNKRVKTYSNVSKLFVGKSPKNPTTIVSGGHGKKWDGNSILLQLPSNRYVFIGDEVYEFTTSEPIIKYHSAVGPSGVPYPVALSTSFAFFMLDAPRHYKNTRGRVLDCVPRNAFSRGIDWSDAYGEYYDRFAAYIARAPVTRLNVKLIARR